MSNGSPTAYLLWAILSCLFLVFLVLHIWAYDRFDCVKWGSGRQPGAFKRVMTYSYLATVPLLVVFSVAMAALKFSEGSFLALQNPTFSDTPSGYFMLTSGERSFVAVVGMPLTTAIARRSIEMCQVYIFLVGSCAGTATTLCFLYVLLRFPSFIRHVKAGGAEPDVVVRLATFYQLNLIRVMFRFLFTIPLLIIAIDAIQPPSRVVRNLFALDFLLMLGGFGCFVSSGITLLIFFPRSLTHEEGYRAKVITPQATRQATSNSASNNNDRQESGSQISKTTLAMELPPISSGTMHRYPTQSDSQSTYYSHADSVSELPHSVESLDSPLSPDYESDAESEAYTSHITHSTSPRIAREDNSDLPFQPEMRWSPLTPADRHPRRHNIRTTISLPARPRPPFRSIHSSVHLHPYVLHFTSPIDLVDSPTREPRTSN
ncbi:hypothetical protein Ac2012v2_003313 [Leucoagaricus gongylophorus]